ncbi:hypothetical protein [Rhizobium herbae]
MSSLVSTETPISRFIEKHLMHTGLNYQDVAVMAGYTTADVVYRFMRGEARVPLDSVPALAAALDCDGAHLFMLALQQYFNPEMYQQIEDLMRPAELPETDREWLEALHDKYGASLPHLSVDARKKLKTVLSIVTKPKREPL